MADRVAVVTGGGSGIGAAIARSLASEGACVVVADVVPGRADRVADEIGVRARGVVADVSVESDVAATIGCAVDEFGGIDILGNTAALVEPAVHALDGGGVDMDADIWDRVMAVNVRGPMLGCKHAVPHMRHRGRGAIVNLSSGSARFGDLTRTAYGASKAAVEALTRYVATQHGPDGIRVNAIAPGLVLTPAAADHLRPEQREVLAEQVLTTFFGEPDDVARMALYLVSDDARYVTGQVFAIDGGLSAHSPTYAGYRALT